LLRAAAVLAVTAIVGVAALLVVGSQEKRSMAFTLGVVGDRVAVRIEPGHTACQTPIDGSAPFDAVELSFGTYGLPGPPLTLLVRDTSSGRELSAGRLAGGYPDNFGQTIELTREVPEGPLAVCVRNAGSGPVALYGNAGQAAYLSTLRLDGRDVGLDAQMIFRRDEPVSVLSLTGDMFERASLFKPSWVGAWTFWVLGVGIVLLVPLLIGLSLRAAREDAPASAS
jgi:hypothetical protein